MKLLQFMDQHSKMPELLTADFLETCAMIEDFIIWLKFSVSDTSREPHFAANHLLSFLTQDIIETLIIIINSIQAGAHNPAKREARFLLELSIKLSYIQQKSYDMSIEDKIKIYKSELNSSNIGIRTQIAFTYLDEQSRVELIEEIGRVYGEASNYVHLTCKNVNHRIKKMLMGNYIGNESVEEVKETNRFLKKLLSYCILFIFESLPEYVVGDWFAMLYPEDDEWYYLKSKYIAKVDSFFDYKAERIPYLNSLIEERIKRIEY